MIWASENYIKENPKYINNIIANKNNPFMTDNLFHTIIDINKIETPYLNGKLSNINPLYNSGRMRILEDGNNYDSK